MGWGNKAPKETPQQKRARIKAEKAENKRILKARAETARHQQREMEEQERKQAAAEEKKKRKKLKDKKQGTIQAGGEVKPLFGRPQMPDLTPRQIRRARELAAKANVRGRNRDARDSSVAAGKRLPRAGNFGLSGEVSKNDNTNNNANGGWGAWHG